MRQGGIIAMNKEDFIRIKQDLSNFRYTSLNYADYDGISEYKILHQDKKLILIYGYNVEAKKNQYHWAGNTAEDLLKAIDNSERNILLTFIPHEWVEDFKKTGFEVFAIWNDYFKTDLSDVECNDKPKYLTEDECEEASQVTLSCRGQSRGFTGQTTEWMKLWIKGAEAATNGDVNNCAVLIHKDNGKITGVVCTGTYAHDSSKGPIVWIREAAVRPDFQRHGIARKLIRQALAYGKKHGATRAFLAADECNEHAIHLYESLGFRSDKDSSEIDMFR